MPRARLDDWDELRRLVFEREWFGRCIRCGEALGVMWSVHHRKLRSQGGDNRASNLIALCGSGTTGCHGWVHHNRDAARVGGFCVLPTDDPARCPVRSAQWGGMIYLNDDWTVTLVA